MLTCWLLQVCPETLAVLPGLYKSVLLARAPTVLEVSLQIAIHVRTPKRFQLHPAKHGL